MRELEQYIAAGASPMQSRVITFKNFAEMIQNTGQPFFIYGATGLAKTLLEQLYKTGLLPRCLCDSDPKKHRKTVHRLPITSPEDAVERNPGAICMIAIRTIATCYEEIFTRLETAGCAEYYIVDWDLCHYIVRDEWKLDLTSNMTSILSVLGILRDTVSVERYKEFILSYLSGHVTAPTCLGTYKPKDGHPLKNDLIQISSSDVLLSCRCGLDRQNERFVELAGAASQVHLLEPTLSGRVRTSELLGETEDKIFLYPFFPSPSKGSKSFEERHCFVKYIDNEEYIESDAPSVALDAFSDINPTVIYLDMTGFHIDALKSAENIVNANHPVLVITGFRLASEAAKLMHAYPNFKWHVRHFGGQTMREGYTLIALC